LNQQNRIAQIASTSVSAERRIKKLQKKRVLLGGAFVLTLLGLVIYTDNAYAKTLISLPKVIIAGALCGVVFSLLLPQGLRLNLGLITLIAVASSSIFFALNTNLGDVKSQIVKVPIIKKSTYTGRNAGPYVLIKRDGFSKKLSARAPAYVVASNYVLLNIKTGCFGYKVITSYQLVSE
jgi:cytochrome bd-type quinol oxidase subunit 2